MGLGGTSPPPLGPQVIFALAGGGALGARMVLGLGCSIAKVLFISLPTVSPDGELYILGEWSFQSGSQLE